ncbi:blood vessel epicardial substance-like [Gigantopelta aegis]|uniref:blood vessel epicardial substance-like n=1 Tax=Gigantopelta aegis TaxID=1735272 RepID=UPI001B88E181|nr:blood vessel epicardial substance-like [Gigantopelta aegis]XP_041350701.1 blood vessel epicardial substance-like [Gigantopelta aegis]
MSHIPTVTDSSITSRLLSLLNLTHDDVLLDDSTPPDGDDVPRACQGWLDAQHTLFQMASLSMLISFLTPSSYKYHVFFMRVVVLIAVVLFLLWGALLVCMVDVVAWSAAFTLIDVVHIGYLCVVHFPVQTHRHLEAVFSKHFKPLSVTWAEFTRLRKTGAEVTLPKGSIYAIEGITRCGEKVSLLIKGRVRVTYERLFLHNIEANDFIDSLEFDSTMPHTETDERYQVTITVLQESSLLTWQFPALQDHLDENPDLRTAFRYIIGKDICQKLYQIQEQLLANPDYMRTLPSRQSSMVNLRNSLVHQDSNISLSRLNNLSVVNRPPRSSSLKVKPLNEQTSV